MHYLIIGFILGVLVMYATLKRKDIRNVLYRILLNYLKTIIYDKYKTTEVQVDLSGYFDNKTLKEELAKMKEKNVLLENKLIELSDIVRHSEEKQISQMTKYLQLRQYEETLLRNTAQLHAQTDKSHASSVQCLQDKIDKLSKDQQSATEAIEHKLGRLGCEIVTMKNCYNMSNTMFHDLEKKLASVKNDTEKSIRKCGSLKAWNENLERDVLKNNLDIIALKHSSQALPLASCHDFVSTRMPSSDNHSFSRPDTFEVASSTSKSSVQNPLLPLTPSPPPPPPPPPRSTPPRSTPPPSPPLPLSPSLPSPPPPSRQAPSRQAPPLLSSTTRSTPKPMNTAAGEKVYYRIPITTDILKSVVLKPPGERKHKHRIFS